MSIPCGDGWEDCLYFDPDICEDEGQRIIENAFLWDEDYDTAHVRERRIQLLTKTVPNSDNPCQRI